MIGLIPKIHH